MPTAPGPRPVGGRPRPRSGLAGSGPCPPGGYRLLLSIDVSVLYLALPHLGTAVYRCLAVLAIVTLRHHDHPPAAE
ncbi:hypothetical protein [Streptosporangium sp. NPDC049644]|uniref:hypothetical protein n=1 Tax=Streptosporangium sp. NPDC049644 TaxID=3155507 RepID=UPI003426AFDD